METDWEKLKAIKTLIASGEMKNRPEEQLRQMLSVCESYEFNSEFSQAEAHLARNAIHRELEIRAQAEEEGKRHAAQIAETTKLREEIKKLQEPHWTTTPTFWLVIVSIAISIFAWLFPIGQSDKSPKPAPSNSIPVISTHTQTMQGQSPSATQLPPQTLPIANGVTPSTNPVTQTNLVVRP